MEPIARRPAPSLATGQPRHVYKLMTVAQWQTASGALAFTGSAVDLADGFIHLSTADQVAMTLDRHFATIAEPLMLLLVDLARVSGGVKWEPSRDGALFPHVYGTLPLACWLAAIPLGRDSSGQPCLPVPLPVSGMDDA